MTFVPADELTKTEREVVAAYGAGARLDLAGRPDRTVRAEVLAGLLTGGYPVAGGLGPGLRLDHARVTGRLAPGPYE